MRRRGTPLHLPVLGVRHLQRPCGIIPAGRVALDVEGGRPYHGHVHSRRFFAGSVLAISVAAITLAACTSTPSKRDTTIQSSTSVVGAAQYPPATLQQLKALAASGDPAQIVPFKTNTEGSPSCPIPNVYATVSTAVTGRQLAADETAFFIQKGFFRNPCGAAVFVFHDRAENTGNGYTAGRVFLDNGGPPFNLEVDVGSTIDGPAFTLRY